MSIIINKDVNVFDELKLKTNKQKAKALGTSLRTYYRYKKDPSSVSEKTRKLIEKGEKKLERKYFRQEGKKAYERAKALYEHLKEQGDGNSFSSKFFSDQVGGKNGTLLYEIMDDGRRRKKTDAELIKDMAKIQKFLGMKTSTPEGYDEWKKNVKEASMKTSGITDEDENLSYWDLFNNIQDNSVYMDYVRENVALEIDPETGKQKNYTDTNLINMFLKQQRLQDLTIQQINEKLVDWYVKQQQQENKEYEELRKSKFEDKNRRKFK